MDFKLLLFLTLFLVNVVSSQSPTHYGTTNFINITSKLPYPDPSWYIENIPLIELPVLELEQVYYYRWSSLKRHLRYTVPGAGYIVTEFVHKVFYSKKWDTINAAAGHHIHEAKWLRDKRYVQDYINFWSREGGNAQQYSEWIADSAWNSYLIDSDVEFIKSQLNGLVQNYNGWYDRYDPELGLFFITPHDDAQEQSASSIQTDDPYHGGLGYRPSFNSEMYGNALAISKIAELNGETELAEEFQNRANILRAGILEHLWDEGRSFFYHRQRLNNPNNELLDAREEVGFYPWKWNVPDPLNSSYPRAWSYLFESNEFNSTYGPTTCEQNSQWYDGDQISQCCWWNGNSWPYSTALTLSSLASQVRNYGSTTYANIESYVHSLLTYAKTQYKNGKPYVAECHSPGGDWWVCDAFNHSEHYAHSTYTDNVLTDLIGIQARSDDFFELFPLIPSTWSYFAMENLLYHGHNISVVYDSDGTHYPSTGGEIGLQIYVNGLLVLVQPNIGPIVVPIPPPILPTRSAKSIENYATNPELQGYPRPNASFTDPYSSTWHAIDGRIFYDYVPVNRWSNFESPNAVDWYEIDLGPGRAKLFNEVRVYVYSDVVTGEGRTDCPRMMSVEIHNPALNTWTQVMSTTECLPNNVNVLNFQPIRAQRLRVLFERDIENNYYIGITELELWAEYPQTTNMEGEYEFEDGFLNQANILGSEFASSGSYVSAGMTEGSTVEISGIWAETSSEYSIDIYYANTGSANINVILITNNFNAGEITFPPTVDGSGIFETFVSLNLGLLRGNNNIVLSFSNGETLELDKISIRKN